MIGEVISIGDELTSGERLDTNSQWLSQRLGELGIAVYYHTTVADDLAANVDVFRQAVGRADVVVATGGLGPTADDLTREALARLSGVELVLDQASLDYIRGLFSRRGREMPERNIVQAMFPASSRVIPNPHGTAPGVDLDVLPPLGRPARIFALPGVPAEMREMWQATVAPRLIEHGAGARVIRHRRIKCFGVGESDLEQMLPDLIRRGRTPRVGITVSDATITLRLTAEGCDDDECLAAMAPTIGTIRECLQTLVFGEEDDELPDVVVRLLAAREATLATAEWGTAGLIAHWLGEVPGSAAVYRSGIVIGHHDALANLLGIGPTANLESTAGEHDLAGGGLVAAMASAMRRHSGTDFALAVGPFPAFDPLAAEPERVWFALATPEGTSQASSPFAGHPSILKPRAAKQALNFLRLKLIGG